jgi:putative transposase
MSVIRNEAREETDRWLNNRAEKFHQPLRRREQVMAKFKSTKSLQKFASIHHFGRMAATYRLKINKASASWLHLLSSDNA